MGRILRPGFAVTHYMVTALVDDRLGDRRKREADRPVEPAHFNPERIFSRISPSSGKRPVDFLEKINAPSTVTSKTPPPEATSLLSTFNACFNSSAKLAARGL